MNNSAIIFNEIKNTNTIFNVGDTSAKVTITLPSSNSNLMQIFNDLQIKFTSEVYQYNNTTLITFVNKDVVLLLKSVINEVIDDSDLLKKFISILTIFKDIISCKIVLFNYFKTRYSILKTSTDVKLSLVVFPQDVSIITLLTTYSDIVFSTVENTALKRKELTFTHSNIIDILSFMLDDLYLANLVNPDTPLMKEYNKLNYNLCINNALLQCKFEKIDFKAITPTKKFASDVGYDLSVIKEVKKLSKDTTVYDTGIKIIPPFGYYVEIVPRSSIAKSNVVMANSVGIIDASYRGTLLVALTTKDNQLAGIQLPFKCCQIVLKKHNHFIMTESKISDTTIRGSGAMGSTGTM